MAAVGETEFDTVAGVAVAGAVALGKLGETDFGMLASEELDELVATEDSGA